MKVHAVGAIAFLVILLLLPLRPPLAHTIDRMTWTELVAGADLVAIVECTVAGGIVAEYRVVRSWKGPPSGTIVRIRMAYHFQGPQFPYDLVGTQSFVTASKGSAPRRLVSESGWGNLPIWWREIPAEYSLPLFQGSYQLPAREGDDLSWCLGSHHASFEDFLGDMEKFLNGPPQERELAALKAQISKRCEQWKEWHLADSFMSLKEDQRGSYREFIASATPPPWEDKVQRILAAETVDQCVRGVVALSESEPERLGGQVVMVLRLSGCEYTLKTLAALSAEGVSLAACGGEEVAALIRENLVSRNQAAEASPAVSEGTPTLRERALQWTEHVHIPADILAWEDPERSRCRMSSGYVIGSAYAWRTVVLRQDGWENRLRELARAKDPFIRVAGATYLCFPDEEEGMRALRELTSLPGNPGVWAALTLARRGEKRVIPRALEAFAAQTDPHTSTDLNRILRARIHVLLSNSTAGRNIPQPSCPPYPQDVQKDGVYDQWRNRLYAVLSEWWRDYGGRIELTDPWLDTLSQSKLD